MGSTNKVRSAKQAITPRTVLGLSLFPVRPVLPSHPLRSQPREADLLSQALDLCCCQHGHMSAFEDTAARHYRWKQLYGGLGPSELRKMRQLEEENQKLKRLVADLSLDKAMLQEVLAKKV